jgi:hypothetical protein
MLGKLLNVLVAAAMLASVAWYYRDTDTVRQRRPQIESLLSKIGLQEDTLRRYWPLNSPDPAPGGGEERRYNPIDSVRQQLQEADRAQRERDDALRKADK